MRNYRIDDALPWGTEIKKSPAVEPGITGKSIQGHFKSAPIYFGFSLHL